jgi:hypothetical protein
MIASKIFSAKKLALLSPRISRSSSRVHRGDQLCVQHLPGLAHPGNRKLALLIAVNLIFRLRRAMNLMPPVRLALHQLSRQIFWKKDLPGMCGMSGPVSSPIRLPTHANFKVNVISPAHIHAWKNGAKLNHSLITSQLYAA